MHTPVQHTRFTIQTETPTHCDSKSEAVAYHALEYGCQRLSKTPIYCLDPSMPGPASEIFTCVRDYSQEDLSVSVVEFASGSSHS
eukprot:3893625-Amphidinium_carterae.1